MREGIIIVKAERMGHSPGAAGSHFASIGENGANTQEAARKQVLMTARLS